MSAAAGRFISIVLDRGSRTFTPGESLKGTVAVKFSQPQKVNGIKLVITGESIVGWNGRVPRPGDSDQEDTVFIHSYERYLFTESYLFGGNAGGPIELPSAELVRKFSYPLQKELPSSIEHDFGSIRYTIKAVVERPMLTDSEAETNFQIISHYDLNDKAQAIVPIKEDVRKTFCYFCLCPWGKMHVTISIPRSGFAIGQVIPVTVHCENESCVTVSKIRLRLRQELKFFATNPVRRTRELELTMVEKKSENPFNTTSEDHVTVDLLVPPLPPSTLEYCGTIDLKYLLKVEVCFSGMHCSIDRTFPILIGTVPLRESSPIPSAPVLEQPSSYESPFNNVSPPGSSTAGFDPTAPPFPPAPPTYEETMKNENPGHSYGNRTHLASDYSSKSYGTMN